MVNFTFFQPVTELLPNTHAELFDQSCSLGLGLEDMRSLPVTPHELTQLSSFNSCLVQTAQEQERPNLRLVIKVTKRLFPNAQ